MSKYTLSSVKKEKDKELFLRFPAKIYDESHIMQDKNFEREVLDGTHLLCKEVQMIPLIVKDEKENMAGRSLLSWYKDDESAYIGFFECIKISEAAKILLDECEKIAKGLGKKRLTGPMNLSFWGGYRFATDEALPYTGEPVNKSYYISFWEENGFNITEKYYSNIFDVVDERSYSAKAKERLDKCKSEGYTFKHPNLDNLEKYLREIHPVLMEGYKDFTGFKKLSIEDFSILYSPLKMVLDPEMVFLAYKEEKLKGFLLCIPDYGNLLSKKHTYYSLLKVMTLKANAKRYILLYTGVEKDCLGLGSALSQLAYEMLITRKASAISALIHEGKASGGYFKDKIKQQRKYVLLEKRLEE